MRVLIVGFMAFLFTAFILWLAGAFISGVWSPMLWAGPGRFLYVVMLFVIALPAGVLGSCGYYEEIERKRKR